MEKEGALIALLSKKQKQKQKPQPRKPHPLFSNGFRVILTLRKVVLSTSVAISIFSGQDRICL